MNDICTVACMMHKCLHLSQIGEYLLLKNAVFKKLIFDLVNMNKSISWIRTRELWFTSPILEPLSYDDIQPNRLTRTV